MHGGERWSSCTDSNHYKFTGKERDTETQLDYFGARYYGSTMGRFLSADEFTGGPVDLFDEDEPASQALPYADITNPQSVNKYTYTYNNPLRYTDPNGHDVDDDLQSGQQVGTPQLPIPPPQAAPPMPAPTPRSPSAAPEVAAPSVGVGAFEPFAIGALAYANFRLAVEIVKTSKAIFDENETYRQEAQAQAKLNRILLQKQQQREEHEGAKPDRGHHSNISPHNYNDHTKPRAGDKKPPGYKSYKNFEQPKNDKKKDRKKSSYVRKDRDSA